MTVRFLAKKRLQFGFKSVSGRTIPTAGLITLGVMAVVLGVGVFGLSQALWKHSVQATPGEAGCCDQLETPLSHGSASSSAEAVHPTSLLLIDEVRQPSGGSKGTTQALSAASPSTIRPSQVMNQDWIRVGISDDAMTALEYPVTHLSPAMAYQVIDLGVENKPGVSIVSDPSVPMPSQKVLYEGAAGEQLKITASANGLTFVMPGKSQLPLAFTKAIPHVIRVVAKTPNPDQDSIRVLNITRKGKIPAYRGHMDIYPSRVNAKNLTLVNVLPLQEYLKAVVPNEMPYSFGYEAVKAQAVAARNYAIRPRENPWAQFDICDSQYCQVYFGKETEHPLTSKALSETSGLVALYAGEPILALFSSAHGGVQEAYHNAFSDPKTKSFPAPSIPYLMGDGDLDRNAGGLDLSSETQFRQYLESNLPSYEDRSSYLRWSRRWDRAQLERTLNRTLLEISRTKSTEPFVFPAFKPGDSVGTLQHFDVVRRGVSGKIVAMTITGTGGKWTLQKEFVIRKALEHNGKMLPSANIAFFHLTQPDGALMALEVKGAGFGHGVGMSQYGAGGMSRAGKPFSEIVQYYYPGVSLGTVPIEVGSADALARANIRAMETTFFVNHAQGFLRVSLPKGPSSAKIPLVLEINHQRFQLPEVKDSALVAEVSQYLKPNQMNRLVVYPHPQQPQSGAKVWIELYPNPKAEWVKTMAQSRP